MGKPRMPLTTVEGTQIVHIFSRSRMMQVSFQRGHAFSKCLSTRGGSELGSGGEQPGWGDVRAVALAIAKDDVEAGNRLKIAGDLQAAALQDNKSALAADGLDGLVGSFIVACDEYRNGGFSNLATALQDGRKYRVESFTTFALGASF